MVPKKGGIQVIENPQGKMVVTRPQTGYRVCIDYRKLNEVTRKDHFPLPFIDQMLERLEKRTFYCFLDEYSGYFQIAIAPEDQAKQLSLVRLVLLHTAVCHLVYVKLQVHFNAVW